jgi:hypothetical protein
VVGCGPVSLLGSAPSMAYSGVSLGICTSTPAPASVQGVVVLVLVQTRPAPCLLNPCWCTVCTLACTPTHSLRAWLRPVAQLPSFFCLLDKVDQHRPMTDGMQYVT